MYFLGAKSSSKSMKNCKRSDEEDDVGKYEATCCTCGRPYHACRTFPFIRACSSLERMIGTLRKRLSLDKRCTTSFTIVALLYKHYQRNPFNGSPFLFVNELIATGLNFK